jgi:hypothetical protein
MRKLLFFILWLSLSFAGLLASTLIFMRIDSKNIKETFNGSVPQDFPALFIKDGSVQLGSYTEMKQDPSVSFDISKTIGRVNVQGTSAYYTVDIKDGKKIVLIDQGDDDWVNNFTYEFKQNELIAVERNKYFGPGVLFGNLLKIIPLTLLLSSALAYFLSRIFYRKTASSKQRLD